MNFGGSFTQGNSFLVTLGYYLVTLSGFQFVCFAQQSVIGTLHVQIADSRSKVADTWISQPWSHVALLGSGAIRRKASVKSPRSYPLARRPAKRMLWE